MSKKIAIIIKHTDTKIGKRGEVIKVFPGYAFNYLIPNGIAEIATKGKLKHLRMIQAIESSKLKEIHSSALILKNNLEQVPKISIKKTLGDKRQIFGRISEKEIISQIYKYTGKKLEKKHITIPEIKKVGVYNIKIQVFQDLTTNFKLLILPESKNLEYE